jgi:protein involved in sex pheromone biosynthesis
VDTTVAVQLGLATAMAAFSPDSANYEQLKKRIESQRSALRGVVGQQVYDSYLYTYDKISDQEMNLYVDFLESGPGLAFSQVVTTSIQKAITDPVESVGRQIARFLAPAGNEK